MTEQVENVALVPCGLCGSPCRVEIFGPSNNLETEAQIWICSNAEWFKGDCRSASVYLSADDWNHCNHRTPPDDSVAQIVAWLRDPDDIGPLRIACGSLPCNRLRPWRARICQREKSGRVSLVILHFGLRLNPCNQLVQLDRLFGRDQCAILS